MQQKKTQIVYAAGGLVWKQTPDGKKIAVVYREKYNDWSLPKGKMEEMDRNLEETALREVLEETGVEAIISGLAGCVYYPAQGKTKFVVFYNMDAGNGTSGSIQDDVQHCQWLSVAEAYKRLTYSREKRLLENLLPLRQRIPERLSSLLHRFYSASVRRRRLAASINSLVLNTDELCLEPDLHMITSFLAVGQT
jgi:8-oxo-dGTP diphosphatase